MCDLLFDGLGFYTQYVEKPEVANTILVEPLQLLRQALSGIAHLHSLGIGKIVAVISVFVLLLVQLC